MHIKRRDFIATTSALAIPGCTSQSMHASQSRIHKHKINYPFTLGVASGDPVSDGFVIWTRLAPDPLSEDGGLLKAIPVEWQISTDENFASILQKGETTAVSEWGHSVHIEVFGLEPLRPYFYRFIADGHVSPVGRAKTTPPLGAPTQSMRFAFASCQHYEQGFFNAYHDIVAQNPDLIIHLGDYIYEASWGPQIRRQASADAMTLSDYRRLHAQYKTDDGLQAAHAAAPWLFIWDDHEVANDYAAYHDENYMPEQLFKQRRAAAYQAYYEHMPIRLRSRPKGPDMRFFDFFHYGDLMTIALTDARQYRDNQACPTPQKGGAQLVNCSELANPTRSMFGSEQERWLMASLARTGAHWEVLAQSTLFSRLFQFNKDNEAASWSDGWDGYPFTRARILEAVAQRKPENFISIGGDMHSWWQADLKADYNDPESRTIGTEFVTTSITSHSYAYERFMKMLPDNPHIHFFDDRKRGYALVDVSKSFWEVTLREMDSVYSPKANATTRRKYIVESGKPGAEKV